MEARQEKRSTMEASEAENQTQLVLTAKTANEIDSLKTRIQGMEQQLGVHTGCVRNVGRERLQAPEAGYVTHLILKQITGR